MANLYVVGHFCGACSSFFNAFQLKQCKLNCGNWYFMVQAGVDFSGFHWKDLIYSGS